MSIILFDRYVSSKLDRVIGDTPLFSEVPFIFMFTNMNMLRRYIIPALGIVNAFTWGSTDILLYSYASPFPSLEAVSFVFLPMMISKRFKVIGSSRREISSSSRSPSDVVLRLSGSDAVRQLPVRGSCFLWSLS